MGEAGKDALRMGFDGSLKHRFHGSMVTSDAGLLPYRELVVTDARYVMFQPAEVAVPQRLFRAILGRIGRLRLGQWVPA